MSKNIEYYNKEVKLNPNDAGAYNNRGNAYSDLGEYEKAIEDYNKAIELDSNDAIPYNNRGNAYYKQKNYEKAIEDYNKVIELDSNDVSVYNNRGNAYYNQKNYEKAIEDYNKAIELDSNNAIAYNNRGDAYYNQKNYEKAIEGYNKAIELDSNNAIAYNNRGNTYYDRGDNEKAIKDYSKAIEIDPDYRDAYYSRRIIYKEQKEKEKENKDTFEIKRINVKLRDEDFYKYIETFKFDMDIRLKIYELFLSVMKLKDNLIYKDNDKEICHYTKISSLKYLLKFEPESGKLRLNNVSYMNDPTEGQTFIELLSRMDSEHELSSILKEIYNSNDDGSTRKIINGKSNIFLCSFSNAIDSLPMWVQYSQNGEGCSLVFNSAFFDKKDKNSFIHVSDGLSDKNKALSNKNTNVTEDAKNNKTERIYYCLHKIKYIDNNDSLNEYKDSDTFECIKEIAKNLRYFKNDFEKTNGYNIKEIIRNILDQVRFLFKDKKYNHEQEVRIVKSVFNDKDVKHTDDSENFRVPHVYIVMNRKLELDEVILGPKVQDSKEIANYLYYTNKVKKVSKSVIKYQ